MIQATAFKKLNSKELIAKFDRDMQKRTRWNRFILVTDQMGNVLFLNGSQDETISSHIGRKIKAGTATVLNKFTCCILRKFESKHCMKSIGE